MTGEFQIMAVYTVHEPSPTPEESAPDPERFIFVRDGFSFAAFLFGPLWMLWHRMWLVCFGYLILAGILEIALHSVGASTGMTTLVGFLLALLIGITLRNPASRVWRGRCGWRSPSTSVPRTKSPRPRGCSAARTRLGHVSLTSSQKQVWVATLRLRIVFVEPNEHPDPSHAVALLRARRQRPRSRAAQYGDEFASSHSITSSARA
jgi:hypothetical protein